MPVRLIRSCDRPLEAVLKGVVRSVEPPVVDLVIPAESSRDDDVSQRGECVHLDPNVRPVRCDELGYVLSAARADDVDRECEGIAVRELTDTIAVRVSVAGTVEEPASLIPIVLGVSLEMFKCVVFIISLRFSTLKNIITIRL